MAEVVVVAKFRARPGCEAEVVEALRETIEQSHGERGCERYALHRDPRDPALMIMVESWTSRAALDEHLTKPYVTSLGDVAARLLAEPPEVRFVEPIVLGDPAKGAL
jgi:quinol monooxygenase YgiN